MKKFLTIYTVAAIALSGCLKIKEDPKAPTDFDVTVTKTTYKLGETTNFTLSGNPNFITFFSGETGTNYTNIQRYSAAGVPKLQFSTARNAGTQANSLKLLASTDFAGLGTDSATNVANLNKATWTDITSRATLSSSTATVASGAIDLSDLLAAKKPIYLAFKYTGTAGTIQNKWTVSALTLINTLPDGTVYTIANLTAGAITNYGVPTIFSPGWVTQKVTNNIGWVVTAGTSLVVTGPATVAASTKDTESWVLCGTIGLDRVSPDVGVGVKETSTRLTNPVFSYTFKSVGTFDAVFLAQNTSVYGTEIVTKHVSITITP